MPHVTIHRRQETLLERPGRASMKLINRIGVPNQHGLTLIEVSVVLMILGFALGAALMVANAKLESAKVSATKERQLVIKTAIQNFIATQGRLPCPAVPTLAQGAGGYGAEAANPGACSSVPNFTVGGNANRISRGIVPWVALNIPEEASIDGYGRRFSYQVRRTQTNLTAATITSMSGNVTVLDTGGGNVLNTNEPAVIAVISHGNNGWGAYLPITGTRITANGGDPDEDENTDNDLELVDRTFSKATGDAFDDIVMWLGPRDLLTDLERTGVVETQAAQSRRALDQLDQIKNTLVAHIAADDANPTGPRNLWRRLPMADRTAACNPNYFRATPNLPAGSANDGIQDQCLTGSVPYITMGIPVSAVTDLWGNLIVYTVANDLAHTTSNSSGLSTTTPDETGRLSRPFNGNTTGNPTTNTTLAFTLNSSGPDGTAGNADDVSLSVTVAQLRAYVVAGKISLD